MDGVSGVGDSVWLVCVIVSVIVSVVVGCDSRV